MSDVGDQKILQIECRSRLGVLTDPDTIRVFVKKPTDAQGIEVVPVTKISVGLYEVLYPCTIAGIHLWRVETTGAITGAEERSFEVEPQLVTHA